MSKRILDYGEAINEAHRIALKKYPNCFVIGQGVNNPWFVGKTTTGLVAEFGANRVMDSPVSEAAMTGACLGAAMAGMKPIVFHPRMDFMYLTLDQLINHGASWHYMFNGKVNVPIVIRGIVNRGGEQGAQHSQSPFAIYANIPGLKVVCPATPEDAKGLLLAAIADPNPVVYIDDRWLYDEKSQVPEGYYETPIGKANVLKNGKDISIIAASYMVKEAIEASKELEKEGISCEVVDIRTIKPIDFETICKSVEKTGLAIVAIEEWKTASVSSTISDEIQRRCFNMIKLPVELITLPDLPAPASESLEKAYYKRSSDIIDAVKRMLKESN